jgi:hypothetical protein
MTIHTIERPVVCAVCNAREPTGAVWLTLTQCTGQDLVDVGAVCSWQCVARLAQQHQEDEA